MGSLRVFFVSIALLACAGAAFSQNSARSEATVLPFRGEWRQIDLEGQETWDEGRCAMQYFKERIFAIEPFTEDPRKVIGTYVVSFHGRYLRNDRRACRRKGEKEPSLLFNNMRIWELGGRADPSTGDLRIEATFQSCRNQGCDDEDLFRKGFKTTLRRVGDHSFISTFGTPSGEDDTVFLLTLDVEKKAQEAASKVSELFLPLLDGRFNRFYEFSVGGAWRETSSWQDLKLLGDGIRPHLEQVQTRTLVEARYANRWPGVPREEERRFALAIHALRFRHGGQGVETALLEQEAGEWKLAGLWLQF